MRVFLLVLLFAFAGCLSPVDNTSNTDGSTDLKSANGSDSDSGNFPVVAHLKNCQQAAGIAWYPVDVFAEWGPQPPFELANIREDIGDARFYGVAGGVPPLHDGSASGNWHMAVRCDGQDLGFVGVRILPPPWDDGTITRQYLATSLSLPPGPLRDGLEHHVPVTDLLDMELTLTPAAIHTMHRDPVHGRYQTDSVVLPAGARGSESIRIWMLIPETGEHHHSTEGRFRPAAIDFIDSGDKTGVLSPETVAVFSHTETDMHGALPGGAGNVVAAGWDAFDRSIRLGPAPDVWVDETYVH